MYGANAGAADNRHLAFWERACDDAKQQLISYARRLAKGRVYDADDLFQDTVCRIFVYLKNPEDIRNPVAYLLRTMRNVWLDKRRQEDSSNIESLDDMLNEHRHPTVDPQVTRLLENNDLKNEMQAGKGPLSREEKQLLSLYLEGYKCGEIAGRMNWDVYRTRSELNAVKAKVRYRLKRSRMKKSISNLTAAA